MSFYYWRGLSEKLTIWEVSLGASRRDYLGLPLGGGGVRGGREGTLLTQFQAILDCLHDLQLRFGEVP